MNDDDSSKAIKELEGLIGCPVMMPKPSTSLEGGSAGGESTTASAAGLHSVLVLPPLPGFKFLHLSMAITKCERVVVKPPVDPNAAAAANTAAPASANPAGKASASATKPAPAAAGKGGKDAAPAAAAATPAAPAEVMETVKPPALFSPAISRLLNPLTISISSASNVPGLSLADGVDKRMEKLLKPTPYSVLKRSCLPAYGILRFYPPPSPASLTTAGLGLQQASDVTSSTVPQDSIEAEQCATPKEANGRIVAVDEKGLLRLPLGQILKGPVTTSTEQPAAATTPPLPPRLVMTPMQPQSSDLAFDCTTVYCLGLHDPSHLRTWLKTRPITLELHDRHCDAWEVLQEEGAPAPAALPPPGYSLAAKTPSKEKKEGAAGAEGAASETATPSVAPPAASPAPGSAKAPASASTSKPAPPGSANTAAAAAAGGAPAASAGPGGKPGSALPTIAEGTSSASTSSGPRAVPTIKEVLTALALLNASTASALRKQQKKLQQQLASANAGESGLLLMSPGGASLHIGLLSSPLRPLGTGQEGGGTGGGFGFTVGGAPPQTPSKKGGAGGNSISLASSRKDIGGQWPYLWLPLHRIEAYQGMVDGTTACPFEQFHQHAAEAAAKQKAEADAAAAAAATASSAPVPASAGLAKGAAPGSAKQPSAAPTARAPSAGLAGQVPGGADAVGSASAPGDAAGGVATAAAPTGPPLSAAKHPLQLVDSLIMREVVFRALSSRERHPHGLASFRLDALLDRAPEQLQVLAAKRGNNNAPTAATATPAANEAAVAAAAPASPEKPASAGVLAVPPASSSAAASVASPHPHQTKLSVDPRRGTGTFAPPLSLTMTAPVLPRQRLFVPLTPEPLYALSSEQKLCREVGAYNRYDTTVKVKFLLAYPTLLHRKGPSPLIQHHLDIAMAEAAAKTMQEAEAKAKALAEAAAKTAPAAGAAPSAGPAGKKPPSAAVGGKADPKAAAAAAAAAPAPAPVAAAPPADDPIAKAKKEIEERERRAKEARENDVTPVNSNHPPALFERVLLSFPYQDDETLKRVLDAVEASNCAALPHASASLRSYKLTQEETEGIEKGKYDVITGVELIDTGSKPNAAAADTDANNTLRSSRGNSTLNGPAATAILGGKRARRIFILEALSLRCAGDNGKQPATKGLGMLHTLFKERGASDPQALFYLCNQQITFERRLYTSFQVFPKMIRLRMPLQAVLSDPATYHPESVSRPLFDTLNGLRELQKVDRFKVAHSFDLFPTADGLRELEHKYGDAVSLVDAYGSANPDAYALEESIAKLDFTSKISSEQALAALDPVTHSLDQATMAATMAVTGDFSGLLGEGGANEQEDEGEQRQHARSRAVTSASHALYNLGELASTLDASANTYDKMKATKALERLQRDVVKTNILAADELAASKAREKPAMTAEYLALTGLAGGLNGEGGEELSMTNTDLQSLLPGGMVYGYSGQKLNTTTWLKEQMMKRLAQDKTANFTYSKDYASATLAIAAPGSAGAGGPVATGPAGSAPVITSTMMNEARLEDPGKIIARTDDLSKWKTAQGFVYPPKKSPEQTRQPAVGVTPFRIEECSMPFIEPAEVKALAQAEERRKGDPAYTGKPAYYRGDVANPHPIKDGVFGFADKKGDPLPLKEFYSSVHLPPGGQDEELAKKKQAEYEAWKAKVLVDDIAFKPYKSSDASRIGRLGSMLEGTLPGESPKPKKLGLKVVHGATLAGSGKPVPLEPAPVSLHVTEPYEDKTNFANTQRPETFKFRDSAIGKPGQDFDLHASLMPPRVKASALYSPLRAAGLSNLAEVGKSPYLKHHKEGIPPSGVREAFPVAPVSGGASEGGSGEQ
jgi:hypothetical protein